MKKLLTVAVLMTAGAALAALESSNEFGYLPVENLPKDAANRKMLAIPFENYGTAGEELNVSEIILTSTLKEGDELYIAKDGGYDVYKLAANGTWTATSKKVTVKANGTIETVDGTKATEATIARGQAVWLKTEATIVSLMGQIASAKATVDIAGGNTQFAYNLVGPSTATAGVALTDEFGATGDRVMLANGTTYVKTTAGWKTTTRDDASKVVIPAGTGFWYLAKGTSKKLTM